MITNSTVVENFFDTQYSKNSCFSIGGLSQNDYCKCQTFAVNRLAHGDFEHYKKRNQSEEKNNLFKEFVGKIGEVGYKEDVFGI